MPEAIRTDPCLPAVVASLAVLGWIVTQSPIPVMDHRQFLLRNQRCGRIRTFVTFARG